MENQPKTHEHVRALAIAYWVEGEGAKNGPNSEILSIDPVLGRESQELLKAMQAYRIVVTNPISVIAGAPTFGRTLILNGDDVYYLNDYKQAAAFLSSQGLGRATDENAAKRALTALVQLSSLEVPTEEHRSVSARMGENGFSASDWETSFSQGADGWVAEAAYLLDEQIYHFVRLAITFSKDGELVLEVKKTFAMRGYS